MAKEKNDTKKLQDTLLTTRKHAYDFTKDGAKKALEFCEGYKEFLDAAKTEREAVVKTVSLLTKAGYEEFDASKKYTAGDKIYTVNREKSVIAATIGKKSVDCGTRLSIAHIDSPRLDLKPNPLYESDDLAFFKTHYYGGIRKYQWVTIPLSMHGVVVKSNGEKVQISIGENAGDPVFCITDLLPHLSQEQNKRPLSEGIKGEELNILIGSFPFDDSDAKERVKLEAMRLINQKYGFTEHDFTRAEIELVPAFKASDIGFDSSMVGAYGQDDRVCAYTALIAEIETKKPEYTSICVLTDKEETGSDGNTGLASDYLFHFMEDLADMQGVNYRKMLANSKCMSADVNAAFDPTFPDSFERKNASFLNYGVVVTKYTGSRGKSGTSDASAEFMGEITNLLDNNGVVWQVGELGKVDLGGGGTIAKFVANHNVDVVDVGVPVLAMHSPFEITGKLDVYNTYLAFKFFAKSK